MVVALIAILIAYRRFCVAMVEAYSFPFALVVIPIFYIIALIIHHRETTVTARAPHPDLG